MLSMKENTSIGEFHKEKREDDLLFSNFVHQQEANIRCWKRLMDIIFSVKWKILIISTVFVTTYIIILSFVTTPRVWTVEYSYLDTLLTICTALYALDTCIHIVHMKVTSYRLTQSHKMYPTRYVVIDVISILPCELIYRLSPADYFYPPEFDISAIFFLNRLLRIYRIPITMRELENNFTFNPGFLYLISVLMLLILLIFFLAFIWLQVLGKWIGYENTWLLYVKDQIHTENSFQWYSLAISISITMICRFFKGAIPLTNNVERLIAATIWVIGLVIEYGVLFGGLLPFMGSQHKLRFDFMEMVQNLKHDMKTRGVAATTVERTEAYNRELWQKTKGIKVEILFKTLPSSFRKELMLDCFWEAFKHSSLLAYHPIEVRRSLSMIMEHEYYLPGEILFRAGTTKDKLVYIVSGIVDVLAIEDESIAVASFTAGTCISEISLAFLVKGKNTVRCATFCVVQTLNSFDALEVLKNYPMAAAEVAECLMQRLQLAKEIRRNAQALTPKELDPLDELAIPLNEIKWVKDHWRKICEMQSLLSRRRKILRQTSAVQLIQEPESRPSKSLPVNVQGADAQDQENVDRRALLSKSLGLGDDDDDYASRSAHTCVFFGLFVLADDEQKAEEDVVCARVHFPWILNTESDFTYIWEIVLEIVVVYECYIMPFYLSFIQSFPDWVLGWGVLSDAILLLDVIITMITAVPGVSTYFIPTLVHRLQSLDIYLKIFIAVPWHFIGTWFAHDKYDAVRLRYLRLTCIVKFIRLFNKWAKNAGDYQYIIKYSLIIGSLIYWMACAEYSLTCYRNICGGRTWYVVYLQYMYSLGIYSDSLSDQVFDMLFYVASNFMRIAFMTTRVMGISSLITVNMLILFSFFITSYFLSEYCSLKMMKNRSKRRFMDLLEKIELYHDVNKMPKMVHYQLNHFMKFQWQSNPNLNMLESTYQTTLPDYLIEDIQEASQDVVRTIPLFATASTEMVKELAEKVTFYHCPKSIQLLRAGEHAAAVYVLRRGFCRAVSHWRLDLERNIHWTLSAGDYFPLMDVMHKVPSILTVTTETACIVAMIEVYQLESVLARFPLEKRLVNAVVHAHNEIWNVRGTPLEDVQGIPWAKELRTDRRNRLPRFRRHKFQFFRSQSHSHHDSVEDSSSEEEDEGSLYEEKEEDYEKAWRQYRFVRFLRPFLRVESFDPTGRFVFHWEMVRSALAFVACLLHPFAYGALIDSIVTRCVCYILDVYCIVDIYVRLQIGYYNEEGVLIIHPALTASNYLTHSFMADLLSCLPLEIFIVDLFFTLQSYAKLRFIARIVRLLQMYRFNQFISHLAERVSYRHFTASITKVIVGLVVALNAVANYFMYENCDVKTEGQNIFYFKEVNIKCNFDNVMADTFLKMVLITPLQVYLLHLYYVVCLYIGCVDGLFVFHRFNILRTLLVSVLTFLARKWNIAVMTSNITTARWQITLSRHVFEEVLSFLRRERVDDKLIRITQKALDFDWAWRRGFKITDLLKKVPPLLQADVLFHRCAKSLYLVAPLKGANEFLLRELSRNIEINLFNKGRYVFRTNDVQDYVYILDLGLLEVICAGNANLCLLRKGAIFGNLPRQQRMRHTCSILVRENSVVFSIPNEVFYNLIEKFPEIHRRFYQVQEAQLEYVPQLDHNPNEPVPTGAKNLDELAATRRDLLKNIDNQPLNLSSRSIIGTLHRKWRTGVFKRLGQSFIMYFVVPPSIICVLLNSALRKDQIFFIVVIYLCDVFYVAKIILTIWSTYKSSQAEKGKISGKFYFWKNIVHSFDLPLDIVSTLPLEFIGVGWLRLNRILRLVTFYRFFKWKYNQLSARLMIRWIRIFISLVILISFLAFFYILVRCDVGRYCEYLMDLNQMHKSFFRVGIKAADIISLAYLFSISRFTNASLTEPPIYSVGNLLYDLIITILDHVFLMYFLSQIACLVCVSRKYRSDYHYLLDRMEKRLKIMNVSDSLLKKCRRHVSNIWRDENGYTMPSWLRSGPRDLRLDLMASMYGKYLQNDPVLGHGHEDLLFQITGYLQRSIFYPNEKIAEKGDVDGCLFILQTGEVKVMAQNEHFLEAVIFEVKPGHLFGVKSGLFEGRTHEYTYRASKTSVVLILDQKDWKYLFEFFPTSASNIYTQAMHATI